MQEIEHKKIVTMSNALTRAGHSLTLGEKRVIAVAVSGIDSKKNLERDGQGYTSTINAIDFAETYGIDSHTAYEQITDAANKLFSRYITFYEPAWKRNGKPLPPTIKKMRWVGQVDCQKGDGFITIHWWPALMKHLVGLQRQFTSYQLSQASALRSAYSWRLLELLMRFKETGWAEYSIEDFCASMDAPESFKTDFSRVRLRIIEPAIKELKDKNQWIIKWEPKRSGTRKVTAVRFTFKKDPQQQLELD